MAGQLATFTSTRGGVALTPEIASAIVASVTFVDGLKRRRPRWTLRAADATTRTLESAHDLVDHRQQLGGQGAQVAGYDTNLAEATLGLTTSALVDHRHPVATSC